MEILERDVVIDRLATWKANQIDAEDKLKYEGLIEYNVYDNDMLACLLKRPQMADVRAELEEMGAIRGQPTIACAKELKSRLEAGDGWDPRLYGALKDFIADEEVNLEEYVEQLIILLEMRDDLCSQNLLNTLKEWLKCSS